ncbi:S8 family peptidase [Candidatus Paracaedibacter symbiosus]|uniref:S8 family peptidase n=1 Tax=Candidatus Paracaedibacter symbiosus TaxID=244582 RepID=UPI000509911A|nr:S8 family serine peptidase [Candidatus Paracaedibacter symbiosus]
MSDYTHKKYLDHDNWVRYTEKFIHRFGLNDYITHLNFSSIPFSDIFVQFLEHEKLEREKWRQLAEDVKKNSAKYLLKGPLHPHKITGVDLLHEEGMTGNGAKAIVWDCGFVDNRQVNFVATDEDQIKYPEKGEKYKRDDEHGTHVAGIIAALKRSGAKKGVAFGAEIQPVEYRGIPDLIERIKNSDTKIISASFHFLLNKSDVRQLDLLMEELEKNDRLLVMAAGNDSKYLTEELSPNFYQYWFHGMWFGNHNAWVMGKKPEMFKRMLLVGSLREDGITVSRFSNLPGVFSQDFVFAPGENVLSTVAWDKFDTMSGTSMATPHVSGLLALMNKYYPTLTALELKQCLTQTCDPFWEDVDNKFGADYKADVHGLGRINAVRAFEEAERLSKMNIAAMDIDSNSDEMEGEAA